MSRYEGDPRLHQEAASALVQGGIEGDHEAQAQLDYMRSASRRKAGE